MCSIGCLYSAARPPELVTMLSSKSLKTHLHVLAAAPWMSAETGSLFLPEAIIAGSDTSSAPACPLAAAKLHQFIGQLYGHVAHRHLAASLRCPVRRRLPGHKRTSILNSNLSAFDPKQTFGVRLINARRHTVK